MIVLPGSPPTTSPVAVTNAIRGSRERHSTFLTCGAVAFVANCTDFVGMSTTLFGVIAKPLLVLKPSPWPRTATLGEVAVSQAATATTATTSGMILCARICRLLDWRNIIGRPPRRRYARHGGGTPWYVRPWSFRPVLSLCRVGQKADSPASSGLWQIPDHHSALYTYPLLTYVCEHEAVDADRAGVSQARRTCR